MGGDSSSWERLDRDSSSWEPLDKDSSSWERLDSEGLLTRPSYGGFIAEASLRRPS